MYQNGLFAVKVGLYFDGQNSTQSIKVQTMKAKNFIII